MAWAFESDYSRRGSSRGHQVKEHMSISTILDSVFTSITTHPTTWSLGVAYVFVAAVNALPEPGQKVPSVSVFYEWLYTFLHVLTNRVVQKFPQMSVPATIQVQPQTMAVPASVQVGQSHSPNV